MNARDAKARRTAPLEPRTDLRSNAVKDIAGALNIALADMFALYLKTKNFHWHMSGPHFRDYHLMLDEQADQIFATTDAIAERVRKIGGTTLRSIGHIGRLQRVLDNDADYVTPLDMLAELRDDNKQLVAQPARDARPVRRARRRGDREPPRGLDRRSRAARLVPVREPREGPGRPAAAETRHRQRTPRPRAVCVACTATGTEASSIAPPDRDRDWRRAPRGVIRHEPAT